MPIPPDPAVLYPDVARHGSLSAALRFVAGGRLASVALTSPEGNPLTSAAVDCPAPHRNSLQIDAWLHGRRWSILGTDAFDDMALIDGRTDDLDQVAVVARAWHDGDSLSDIGRAAPFVRPTGRFELSGTDPAHRTESEWQHLRLEASELPYPWAPAYRNLIESAYAESALRSLYPFTSHWALRFSTTTRPDLNPTGACLTANSDGTFGVGRGLLTPDLGLFTTPGDAVARAVRELSRGPMTA
ncbi:DUF6193 family natural product biosynthesis protein [Streptomyces anulatus]|uniref:DUF6193 family natural product biosynthesis protein n=1 Tax=Streptomyces anulatus TaxID=1892 RepID=UPI003324BEAA